MGNPPLRYQRGSMPDVPAHRRDPDDQVLSCGHFGPRIDVPRLAGVEDIHPTLWEILVRMDDDEASNLKQGLNILVRLEPQDFVRLKGVLKIINIIYGIGRVLKWSVAAFLGGLASVVVAGEQIQKIWGWILNSLKIFRGWVG